MLIKDKPLWILSVLLLGMLTFQQQTSQTYAQQEGKEFLAGVPANFPPHYSLDPETRKPTGFAIDIIDEIARRSGIKVKYIVHPTWPKTIEAIEKGEIDLIPNIGIIAEREGQMDFTSPVETFHIVIFVRETTINISSVEDLNGKEVAVVEKNKGQYLMEERGGSRLQIYASQDEAFLSLISGKSDALVFPEPPVTLFLRKAGLEERIKIVGKPLLEVKRSIAVRKGDHELLKKLDDEVKTFIKTPRYAEIYAKWYGKPEPYWTAKRTAVFGGGLLAFVLITLTAWRYLSLLRLNKKLRATVEEWNMAEEARQESEERFKSFFELTADLVVIADIDGYFRQINSAWLKLLGYTEEELLGKPYLTYVHPDDKEKTKQVIAEKLKRGETVMFFKNRYIRKDGSVAWLEWTLQPIPEKGLTFAIARDITERRQAEEELKKHREHLEELVKERTAKLEEKIVEIDRLNKLFVGRELKMVELKEKIKELEKKVNSE